MDMPIVDYSPTIRAEIEKVVTDLVGELERWEPYARGWYPVDDVVPQYIELGYLVNSHRGEALYREGDLICGIPVRIDYTLTRTITVSAGEVECCAETEEEDEFDEWYTHTEYEDFNAEVSVTL